MSAAGNSSIDLNYSFIDEDKTNGIIYYKLVQVDIDDAQKVYDAISSDCNLQQETIISIFPNPSAQSFTVQMDLENDENIEMVIYNLNGSVAYRQAINGNKGSNTIFVNDLNLKSGFYNIYFTQEAGKSIIIKHCVL